MPDPVAAILEGLRFGVLTEDDEVLGLAEGRLAGPAVPGVVGFFAVEDIALDCQCRCGAAQVLLPFYRSLATQYSLVVHVATLRIGAYVGSKLLLVNQ